jgi:hypothetical protein
MKTYLFAITAAVSLATSSRAQPPSEQPWSQVFQDRNPCTGEVVTFDWEGTLRTHTVGDRTTWHISGTVVASDGFTGSFVHEVVFEGGVISTNVGMDMEANASKQRQMFHVVFHVTVVGGQTVASVDRVALTCIGKP